MKIESAAVLLALTAHGVESFTPTVNQKHQSSSSTQLDFGIPKFLTPQSDEDKPVDKTNQKDDSKSKIGLSGVLQLITAGAGAPFLGDFEGVDEESGKFMFSLEANNLVDDNGQSKQTQMPYFESGWVDPEEQAKADARKGQGFKFPWDK